MRCWASCRKRHSRREGWNPQKRRTLERRSKGVDLMAQPDLFPTGDPELDCSRLGAFWQRELEQAGMPGSVAIVHSPFENPPAAWRFREEFWRGLFLGETQLRPAHI